MAAITTIVAIAGLALTAAGTAASLYGTDTAAKQAEANAKHAAAQANADAGAARADAMLEADRIRKAGKAQRAQATAAAAASGVDVNSPTTVRLDQEITTNAETDALTTIFNADDRAKRMEQQAGADLNAGKAARTAGRVDQASTLLAAAGSMTSSTATGSARKRGRLIWRRSRWRIDAPQVASRTGTSRVDNSATEQVAARSSLGQTAQQVGSGMTDDATRQVARKPRGAARGELLAQAKAANATAGFGLQVEAARAEVEDVLPPAATTRKPSRCCPNAWRRSRSSRSTACLRTCRKPITAASRTPAPGPRCSCRAPS